MVKKRRLKGNFVLLLFCVILMMLSGTAGIVFADDVYLEEASENIKYSGKSGDVNWTIDADGLLTITGSGEVLSEGKTVPAWYIYRSMIKKAKVNLSGKIANCQKMFYSCSNLEDIIIESIDTSSCTNFSNFFNGCKNLSNESVNHVIKKLNTSSAKDISAMFANCTKATNLDLSSFCTTNLEDMQGLFSGCNQLIQVNFTGFSTGNVLKMNRMFVGCKSLKTIDLSNFSTAKCIDFENMFQGCQFDGVLDLSNFNFASMKDKTKNIFGSMRSQKIIVPANLTENLYLPIETGWYGWTSEDGVVRDYALKGLASPATYTRVLYDSNMLYMDAQHMYRANTNDLSIFSNGGNTLSDSPYAIKGKYNHKKVVLYTSAANMYGLDWYGESYSVEDLNSKVSLHAVLTNTNSMPEGLTNGWEDMGEKRPKIASDKEAKKLASVSCNTKKGTITVTAKSNVEGTVYLWVYGTTQIVYYHNSHYSEDYEFDSDDDMEEYMRGAKKKRKTLYSDDVACAKIEIHPTATKVVAYSVPVTGEALTSSTPELKKAEVNVGDSMKVYLDSNYKKGKEVMKTKYVSYGAVLDKNAAKYFEVAPSQTEDNCFIVTATAINGTKSGKGKISFVCSQSGKKATVAVTSVNHVKSISLKSPVGMAGTVIPTFSAFTIETDDNVATASVSIDWTGITSSGAISDSLKLYTMSSSQGFDQNAMNQGKVKITSKPSGEQKKIKVKLSKDKGMVSITVKKNVADHTKVYVLLYANSVLRENETGGYMVFSVETKKKESAQTA